MARVLPIHEFVMTRDKKQAAVAAAAAAGDADAKKMKKYWTNMFKFNSYILRVLKQVDPDSCITCAAVEVMNGIISNMMLKLIHKSFKNSLRRRRNKSKLSVKDINAAVVEVFPPQMAKLARQAGLKARTTRRVSRLSATIDQTMSMK
jgi:histone H2B